jgi:alpha-1,2-mannosyltransferase
MFGLVVEKRSAFMQRRMTDLGVYLRAGWAVRTGQDIYDIKDDNEWHYQYPPPFAVLMVPLADPPPGADRTGMLPYAASVGIWYSLSLLCLIWGVHCLAGALEDRFTNPMARRTPWGCRRWWALRLIPILTCLTPICHTLMRGQVNLLLLALLCGMTAAMVRAQSWRAGLWLAAAICLKVIPAFLLLVPLWRRDARCLAGCALGLVLGLGVIPAAVFGVPRTLSYYREYDEKLLRPGIGAGTDQSRAKELIEMTANDSQSILAAIHNTIYPDRFQRPPHPTESLRWLNYLICGLMTAATLLAAGRRDPSTGTATALLMGTLVLNMLLLSPVCHLHYFSLSVPVVMGMVAVRWDRTEDPTLGLWLTVLMHGYLVANVLPNLPGLEVLRDLGLAMYATVFLWLVACVLLWRQRAKTTSVLEATAKGVAA